MTRRPLTDTARLETRIGHILRAGTILTTVLLVSGVGAALIAPAHAMSDGLLRAGLIILMMTPVARVAVSCLEYLRERDWPFVGVTAVVLLILMGSLMVAISGRPS